MQKRRTSSEEVTDSLPSDDNESDTDSGYFDKNGQYHFDPESEESVQKWMDLYTPNRTGDDFLNLSEDWWNNLTPDELDFAKFATYTVELDPNEYYDQTLDESIEILSNGVDADYYFNGTIFEGITLDDLLLLKENGYSLEDLDEAISSMAFTDGVLDINKISSESVQSSDDILINIAKEASITKSNNVPKMRKVQARAGNLDSIKVKPYVRSTGYFGDKHGEIWWIDLGTGKGMKPALCMDYGNTCRNHYTYENHYENESSTMGYFVYRANSSNRKVRVAAQIAFWLYRGAWGGGGLGYSQNVVKSMVDMMLAKKGNAQVDADREAIKNLAWSVYRGAKNNTEKFKCYVWNCNVGSSQKLVTYERPEPDPDDTPEEPDNPDTPEVPNPPAPTTPDTPMGDIIGDYSCGTSLRTTVNINKKDIETNKPLEDVRFQYSGDFGSYQTTDSNGNCSYSNEDHFSETEVWGVTGGSHEVKVGEDSHGNDIKETKYYYTCESCGQSCDYDSQSSMEEAGEQHCVNHAKEIAEGRLNATVAAYTFRWVVSETDPRTSTYTSNLVTGGTASYTTGYHNNPVITQSNTESGYHRDEHRVINVNLTNERVRGTITINKSDMDYLNCRTEGDNNQDFIPQGDASLAGAVYGLYANADIIRPDGKSGVDRTGLPTNIRMDYCTGSVDDPNAHKTYSGVNPFGIDAIHTTTPLPVPIQQVNYNYTDGTVYHKGDLVAVGMFDRI